MEKANKVKYALCLLSFFAILALITVLTMPSGFSINNVSAVQIYNSLNANNEVVKVQKEDKININTAVLSQLMCLEQIGEKRAQDIINYREENGDFQNINELLNVSGISDSVFEKIEDFVKV